MNHASCPPRALGLSAAFAACLWSAVAAAQGTTGSATVFGFNYSPVGNATLDASSGTGVVVGNLGSAGQDGVSIDISGLQGSAAKFFFETSMTFPGTVPNGSFWEQQGFGSLGGGTNQLLDSETLTFVNSTSSQLTMDISPLWNGQPTVLNFYSGGIGGTLVYSETEAGPTIGLGLTAASGGTWVNSQDGDLPGDTLDTRWKPSLDASITTPGGIVFPAADAVDLVDFGATSIAPVQFSSDAIKAGGGINSFEIIGEQVIVPEPGTLALAGFGAAALVSNRWRRQRRERRQKPPRAFLLRRRLRRLRRSRSRNRTAFSKRSCQLELSHNLHRMALHRGADGG